MLGDVEATSEKQNFKVASVHKSKFYGAFVLNRRLDLHVIDATPARWRGDSRFLAARRSQRGRVIVEK